MVTQSKFVLIALIAFLFGFFVGFLISSDRVGFSFLNSDATTADLFNADLLSINRKYRLARPKEKEKLLAQMVQVAEQRKLNLLAFLKTSPDEFLARALPERTRQNFPLQIQSLIEKSETIVGRFNSMHEDRFDANESRWLYYLEQKDAQGKVAKRHRVYFSGLPSQPLAGATIRAEGFTLDDSLVAHQSDFEIVEAAPATKTTGTTNILAMLVNFQNDQSEPFTADEVRRTLFSNTDSVNRVYTESSFGKNNIAGSVIDWMTLPINAPSGDCSSSMTEYSDLADTLAADSIDETIDVRMYIFTWMPACSAWWGLGGGDQVWINGKNLSSVMSHELGHDYTANHSGFLDCGTKSINTYSSCTAIEYGEWDTMGWNDLTQFNASHKNLFAWLAPSAVKRIESGGTYSVTLRPIEKTAASGEYQLLTIPKLDTGEEYHLSYRQPIGFDSVLPPGRTQGASIYIWHKGVSFSGVKILDASPGSDADQDNTALCDGCQFYDPVNQVTIKQLSSDPSKVTLSVIYGDVKPVPSVSIKTQLRNESQSPLPSMGDSTSAKLGETVRLRLEITNTGGASLSGVVANAIIPSGFAYSSGSTIIDQISAGDGITTSGISLGSISVGETRVVAFNTIVTKDASLGTHLIPGSVDSVETPRSEDTVAVVVGTLISVSVDTTGRNEETVPLPPTTNEVTATPGERVRIRVEIANTGSTQINAPIVKVTLPAQFVYKAGTTVIDQTPAFDGVTTGGLLIGNLLPGEAKVVAFNTTVSLGISAQTFTIPARLILSDGSIKEDGLIVHVELR